ncbi:MAG: hypothetical protein IJU79_04110, partial [Desulfovibrionaceae bacterium]|nr:hypothetical protein [Desulfovibrionaceae bacterium]
MSTDNQPPNDKKRSFWSFLFGKKETPAEEHMESSLQNEPPTTTKQTTEPELNTSTGAPLKEESISQESSKADLIKPQTPMQPQGMEESTVQPQSPIQPQGMEASTVQPQAPMQHQGMDASTVQPQTPMQPQGMDASTVQPQSPIQPQGMEAYMVQP